MCLTLGARVTEFCERQSWKPERRAGMGWGLPFNRGDLALQKPERAHLY